MRTSPTRTGNRALRLGAFTLLLALAACGDTDDTTDASVDAATDVTQDASDDVAVETDVGDDAETDTVEEDAEADTVETDAGEDTAADAEVDAEIDAEDDAETDAVETDVAEDAVDDTTDDAGQDTTPVTCTTANVSGEWTVDYYDDVSIAFTAPLDATVSGYQSDLVILFERYSIGADVGTFTLGVDGDANFGNCAHCVYTRGPSPIRALFADGGTLTTNRDPYGRILDIQVENLRLIEVAVDSTTRESTPLDDGGCLEVAAFSANQVFPADGWTCDAADYDDGELCQCNCGAPDPDCAPAVVDCPPFDPSCELTEALPVADCDAEDLCGFDPVSRTTACIETCEYGATVCDDGVCTPETGGLQADECITSDERIDPAGLDEPCTVTIYQEFCAVEDGVALGYCDYSNVCRRICGDDSECTGDGQTCRPFAGPELLGFCGEEPSDG